MSKILLIFLDFQRIFKAFPSITVINEERQEMICTFHRQIIEPIYLARIMLLVYQVHKVVLATQRVHQQLLEQRLIRRNALTELR